LEHQQLEGGDMRPVEGDHVQLEGTCVSSRSLHFPLVCRDIVEGVPRGCKF
jgi:hypothetical protein